MNKGLNAVVSTAVEKDCVDQVASFIKTNRDAMEKSSQGRDEKDNRLQDATDMANAMVRAAELVWIAHYNDHLAKIFEYLAANSAAVTGMIDKEVGTKFNSIAVALNLPLVGVIGPIAPTDGIAIATLAGTMQAAGEAAVTIAKIPVVIPDPK
jgi:hypothetical protein